MWGSNSSVLWDWGREEVSFSTGVFNGVVASTVDASLQHTTLDCHFGSVKLLAGAGSVLREFAGDA